MSVLNSSSSIKRSNALLFFTGLISLIFLYSCTSETRDDLPQYGKFPAHELTNHNGDAFSFKDLEGKAVLVAYIYTNCPDVCHIISAKLNRFKSGLDEDLLHKVHFVSLTFDPTRDNPNVLKDHAEMMQLDLSGWDFVTGRRDRVYEILEVAGIDPMIDSMESPTSYTLNHRDRISLLDRDGYLRKHYKGSSFDHDELLKDIRSLL